MSIRDWFGVTFGLAPFRDYDLPHEPSTARPSLRAVDGPTQSDPPGEDGSSAMDDFNTIIDLMCEIVDRTTEVVEIVGRVYLDPRPDYNVASLDRKRKGRPSRT